MSLKATIAVSALCATMLVACDKKDDSTSTSTTTTPPAATQPSAVDTMKNAASNAAENTKQAAQNAWDKTKNAASNAGSAASQAIDSGKASVAGETANSAVSQAQGVIDKAKQDISENKLADAKTLLDKLQGMKSDLPTNLQAEIDKVQSMYNTAAGALPSSMPSLAR